MKKALLILFAGTGFLAKAQFINVKQLSSSAGSGNSIMSLYGNQFTSNGNFLLGYEEMMGGRNFIKFNSAGDTVFGRKGQGNFYINGLTETVDGSLYGFNLNNDSLFTLKFSPVGNAIWKRKIVLPAGGDWSGAAVQSNNNENIFAVGSNYWPAGGHALIGRCDSAGSLIFMKSIDMTSWFGSNLTSVTPTRIRITSTGNILLLGNTWATTGTPVYLFLIMMDPSGNIIWTRTCQTGLGNGPQSFYISSLELTANDDILLGGQKQSPTSSVFMRLDQAGNFLWGKTITDNCSGGAQLIGLTNGDLALHMANSNQVSDAVPKNMISILDPSGNLKLTRSFGYAVNNNVAAIGENASGHIIGFGISVMSQELYFYSMDTAGTSTGCYDVIPSLPITSFTNTFVSQTLASSAEALPGAVSATLPVTSASSFTKSSPAIATNGVITSPLCYGAFGAVNITPSGGASPYSYKWSNGTNSQNLLNVPGGIYVLRIADNIGCVGLDTFNVIEPPQLTATYTVSHVTCFGAQNGSINVTTAGGTPGYDYQWTTLATTEDLSGLGGGFYQLTITDTNNCTKTVAVAVSEPQQLIAGIMSSQNVTCHGACDGSLTGVASGGTQPYTYLWNNPGSATTTTVTGLCPGNYLFSVTDSKSCFTFANAVITEPAALSISSVTADAHCGSADGSAFAQVSGGVMPYTYSWSNASTNDTATNLYAGTYTVNVLDANNCPTSTSVNVDLTTDVSELCLVTVDSMSTHNILMWDKTAFTNVDYFNIYREDITNNYTLIAAIDYDSLSEYHDWDTVMADPNVTTKRYKMSAMDTCGNESAKSNFHNTIFIAHNGGTFTWNTYTIQNSANPVTNYLLMRDDFATGNWQQIGSTAGTQNVLNDPNYASFQATADWRVETVWSISCTSTMRQGEEIQGAIIKSKSNITNNRVSGIIENANVYFGMYPNPASEMLNIDSKNGGKVEIVNALGQTVKEVNLNSAHGTLDISGLANGVYYVKIGDTHAQTLRKLVVQR